MDCLYFASDKKRIVEGLTNANLDLAVWVAQDADVKRSTMPHGGLAACKSISYNMTIHKQVIN
jgi:hypothetical protein